LPLLERGFGLRDSGFVGALLPRSGESRIPNPESLLWWREVDYSGHPALRPSGASPAGCSNPLLRVCRTAISSVVQIHLHRTSRTSKPGGGRWIRTTEGVSQQIYSLPPLAAWVSLRNSFLLRSCNLVTCCPGGG